MISFRCPSCQKKYKVEEALAGRKTKCKECQGPLVVPFPESVIPVEVVPTDTIPVEIVKDLLRPAKDTQSSPPLVAVEIVEEPLVDVEVVEEPTVNVEIVPELVSRRASVSSPVLTKQRVSLTPTRNQYSDVVSSATTANLQQLLGSISGPIQPVPTTMSYRLSLVLVAIVMVILPVVYACMIGALGYGMYWHATQNVAIFQTEVHGRGMIALVAVYVAPLAIGTLLIGFMIKPIFAKSEEHEAKRSLTKQEEPVLFAFVDKLCESVHAPKPTRIDINCEVNASASFRNGIWSMFGNDLVLTIGMPLVYGLSTRELAGVLAHEFGHFSQGFGMRLTYLIRTISFWFTHAVYSRDSWDAWLEKTASNVDLRLGIILHLARLFVWLTRRVLWLLMMAGHIVSCNLMRQMEFDADLHECRFAGSDGFESTARKLQRLGVAYQQTVQDQQTFMLEGKLGNDIPKLTYENYASHEKDLIKAITKATDEEKTSLFSTHPADRERIEAARRENARGVFRIEKPASILFGKFEASCQAVTKDFLAEVLEEQFKPHMLIPVEQLLGQKIHLKESLRALARFFGSSFNVPRNFPLAHSKFYADSGIAIKHLRKLREQMIQHLPAYTKAFKEYDQLDSDWLSCFQVITLKQLGISLKQKEFRVPVGSVNEAFNARNDIRLKMEGISIKLQPFEEAFVQRFHAAFFLLKDPEFASQIEGDLEAELHTINKVLAALEGVFPLLDQVGVLRNEFSSVRMLLEALSGQSEVSQELANKIMEKIEMLATMLPGLAQPLQGKEYPFEHADGRISLPAYLLPSIPAKDDVGNVADATTKFLEQFHFLYKRSIGTLAFVIQQVELALDLPILPDPEDEPEEDEEE